MNNIRKPAVAGMFYPSDPSELKKQIDALMKRNIPPKKFNNIFGIIVPHAGYIYSGATAAFAYNTIADKRYKTVIVISPSHREYFQGISIYAGDYYETPFGKIPINKLMRDKIACSDKNIRLGNVGHGPEHALEVQLPFLQVALLDFTLVPIVIGDQNRKYVFNLAEALAGAVDKDTLIVASTDLSHFYSRAKAQILDKIIIDKISEFNYDALQEKLEERNCEACGGGCIVALLKTAELKGVKNSTILNYSDSGYVTKDTSEVVGYLSAVIHG